MIDSRKVDDLHPAAKRRCLAFLENCKAAGIEVLITSTYRDIDFQNNLYAQGRTTPGKIVTKAAGGKSWHNWRLAFDAVPLRNGLPVWGTSTAEDLKLWRRMGEAGEKAGMEWGGRWDQFKDYPHFQFTDGLSLADMMAGKTVRADV